MKHWLFSFTACFLCCASLWAGSVPRIGATPAAPKKPAMTEKILSELLDFYYASGRYPLREALTTQSEALFTLNQFELDPNSALKFLFNWIKEKQDFGYVVGPLQIIPPLRLASAIECATFVQLKLTELKLRGSEGQKTWKALQPMAADFLRTYSRRPIETQTLRGPILEALNSAIRSPGENLDAQELQTWANWFTQN